MNARTALVADGRAVVGSRMPRFVTPSPPHCPDAARENEVLPGVQTQPRDGGADVEAGDRSSEGTAAVLWSERTRRSGRMSLEPPKTTRSSLPARACRSWPTIRE